MDMKDRFFQIYRNIYIKSIILESLYELDGYYHIKNGVIIENDSFKKIIDDRKQLDDLSKCKAQEIDYRLNHYDKREIFKITLPRISKFKCSFLHKELIPNWITHLYLTNVKKFDKGDIPLSVTNLTLEFYRFEQIELELPSTIVYLTLGYFKFKKWNFIPTSVTYLALLNYDINDQMINKLPETIKHIEFKKLSIGKYNRREKNYNIPEYLSSRLVNGVFYIYSKSQDNTNIPLNTTHLFWADSDQIIDNDQLQIPNSVHTLVMKDFSSHIYSLPTSITQMIFNGNLNQPLSVIKFPPSLKYLTFDYVSDTIKDSDLPNGITHLTILDRISFESLPLSIHHLESGLLDIPPHIKHLKITGHNGSSVPNNVKTINIPPNKIRLYSNSSGATNKKIKPDPLKFDGILHLISNKQFNRFIAPNSLLDLNIKSISFGDKFNQILFPGTIPNTVECLEFGKDFNQVLSNSILPPQLKVLKLGLKYNHDLNDVLPSSLTELVLNLQNKPILKSFPTTLNKLTCSYFYGILDMIPISVYHLEFKSIADDCTGIFPIELVPHHITSLVLSDDMCIQSYELIPTSIKHITLCNSIVSSKIPITVESVALPFKFNSPLYTILQTYDDNDSDDNNK